jgi:hypothetical protein
VNARATAKAELVSEVRSFLTKEPEPLPEGERPRQRRPRAPRPISGPDEAALSWFFGQGLSIYEKSTFGPIVQKIAMDGYASTVCGTCDGGGIIEEGGGVTLEDKCRGCGGSGREPHKAGREQRWCITCDGIGRETPYEVELPRGGWCPSCHGTGTGSVERAALRRPRCRWCKPEPFEPETKLTDEQVVEIRCSTAKVTEIADTYDVSRQQIWNIRKGRQRSKPYMRAPIQVAWVPRHCCPNCLGTGDEPITVEPLGSTEEASGVIGSDTALTRFAITSRRVDAVKAISPALHAALEAFYGDMGSRWALTSFGRLFALSHLTPAGKQLARAGIPTGAPKVKAKKKKKGSKPAKKKRADDAVESVQLNAQERIGVQANLQLSQYKDDRKKLLDAAREQAAALYARAARAWNSVTESKGEKTATARLVANLTRLGHGELAGKLQQSAQLSPKDLSSAKQSMRTAGYFEAEIAEAFKTALSETAGGAP